VICGREHSGADMEVSACVPVPRGSTRLGTDRGPHPGHRPHCSRATGPAPPQANGQRERSDRRTASVSWLVETCHARTTSQVTPRSTHLDAVDSRLSPPPNSLLSTLSFLLSRPQAARELAGGNVPRADDIPSHTAPHAVRRRWSNPVATSCRAGARASPPHAASGRMGKRRTAPYSRLSPAKQSPLHSLLSPLSAAGRRPHAMGRADRRGDLTVALPPWGSRPTLAFAPAAPGFNLSHRPPLNRTLWTLGRMRPAERIDGGI
jgi:hypothetical protein